MPGGQATNDAELQAILTNGLTVTVSVAINGALTIYKRTIQNMIDTNQFYTAWQGSSNGLHGSVDFEPGKLSAESPHSGWRNGLGWHKSFADEDVRAEMAHILYDAAMGCVKRPTGRNAYARAVQQLNGGAMQQYFESGLSAAGFKFKKKGGSFTATEV